jgi:hypothetical protein
MGGAVSLLGFNASVKISDIVNEAVQSSASTTMQDCSALIAQNINLDDAEFTGVNEVSAGNLAQSAVTCLQSADIKEAFDTELLNKLEQATKNQSGTALVSANLSFDKSNVSNVINQSTTTTSKQSCLAGINQGISAQGAKFKGVGRVSFQNVASLSANCQNDLKKFTDMKNAITNDIIQNSTIGINWAGYLVIGAIALGIVLVVGLIIASIVYFSTLKSEEEKAKIKGKMRQSQLDVQVAAAARLAELLPKK